jgi:putative restriction endonuclease
VASRVFGKIPGVPVGTVFASRAELAAAGVHRPTQAGISGSVKEGADSVVISGGYEDDEDFGDELIYTGHGGQDGKGRQVANQTLSDRNLALAVTADRGLPLRVVRGAGGDPEHSPASGYSYDGLYRVESYGKKVGRSGFDVYLYRLVRLESENPVSNPPPGQAPGPSARRYASVQRLVRNTAASDWVKRLYHHKCQVCDEVLTTPSGPYAEGAHLRPVGRPHDGPDLAANVLCLCPNDHVRLDKGVITIGKGWMIQDVKSGEELGKLALDPEHGLDFAHAEFHSAMHRPD